MVVSIFGDLFFSFIKRRFNIKDFSNLLPGHGGILDRLDAPILVFTFYFLITVIMQLIMSLHNGMTDGLVFL
ncbi:MAG: phosphatidate cytidylyltransferase [Mycoplasmoidaceae bacterium]|nr:phosphatidate cytidylyltransferase [Mycoplasmoidaceae bacterium]